MNKELVGDMLKDLRMEGGYVLMEVEYATGESSGYLSLMENGRLSPSLRTLDKVLEFYDVRLSSFFSRCEKLCRKRPHKKRLHKKRGRQSWVENP